MGLLKAYWNAYGGMRGLLLSPYFLVAIFLTAVLYPAWSVPGWWVDPIAILPNMLGFSLGGYAMWIAIGDESFRSLISGVEEDGEPSVFMQVNAAFVHFILLQILAILGAIITKAYSFTWSSENFLVQALGENFYLFCLGGYFIGYFLFIYALLAAFAATFALFRVSRWYDKYITNKKKTDNNH